MIKIKYAQLLTQGYNDALNRLCVRPDFPSTTAAWRAQRLIQKSDKETKAAHQLYNNWAEPMFEKDEKGDKIMSEKPNPMCPFKVKEGQQETFNTKVKEFLETEIEIEALPLKLSELPQQGITPQELVMLEPVLDLSDLEQGPPPSLRSV